MIQKFQEFSDSLNENISVWLDYEKDTSGQASDWYNDKITSSNKIDHLIRLVVLDWNEETDDDNKMALKQPHITKLAKEFFNKYNWINGNIISAMLMQEGDLK